MKSDTVIIASWNIEADGGRHGERRGAALDVVAEYRPHVFCQQEAKHSRERGKKRMYATERRLKMRGFLSEPNEKPGADIATAVYLDPEMFQVIEERPHTAPWWLHPCHVQVQLGDCPVPLNLVSFHHCFFDADTRLAEARWLTTLAQPGMATIATGDTNSYPRRPEPVTLPNWPTADKTHMIHRTYLDSDGNRHSDTRPDGELIDAGYVDLARYAADHLGQNPRDALADTAGFDKPRQGGDQRIDRGYCTGDLAPALEHVEVINNKNIHAISDHALVLFFFNHTRLVHQLSKPHSP